MSLTPQCANNARTARRDTGDTAQTHRTGSSKTQTSDTAKSSTLGGLEEPWPNRTHLVHALRSICAISVDETLHRTDRTEAAVLRLPAKPPPSGGLDHSSLSSRSLVRQLPCAQPRAPDSGAMRMEERWTRRSEATLALRLSPGQPDLTVPQPAPIIPSASSNPRWPCSGVGQDVPSVRCLATPTGQIDRC